jgi:hypothetical protein
VLDLTIPAARALLKAIVERGKARSSA